MSGDGTPLPAWKKNPDMVLISLTIDVVGASQFTLSLPKNSPISHLRSLISMQLLERFGIRSKFSLRIHGRNYSSRHDRNLALSACGISEGSVVEVVCKRTKASVPKKSLLQSVLSGGDEEVGVEEEHTYTETQTYTDTGEYGDDNNDNGNNSEDGSGQYAQYTRNYHTEGNNNNNNNTDTLTAPLNSNPRPKSTSPENSGRGGGGVVDHGHGHGHFRAPSPKPKRRLSDSRAPVRFCSRAWCARTCCHCTGPKICGLLQLTLIYLAVVGMLWLVAFSTRYSYTNAPDAGAWLTLVVCVGWLVAGVILSIVILRTAKWSRAKFGRAMCLWNTTAAVCVLVIGMAAGQAFNYQDWVEDAPYALSVNPAAAVITTSRAYAFRSGSFLDLARGNALQIRVGKSSRSHCTAPVVSASNQTIIHYWVYDEQCCWKTLSECTGWDDPSYNAGVLYRSIPKEATMTRLRAEELFNMTSAEDTVTLWWSKDIHAGLLTASRNGVILTYIFTFGWPLVTTVFLLMLVFLQLLKLV